MALGKGFQNLEILLNGADVSDLDLQVTFEQFMSCCQGQAPADSGYADTYAIARHGR